MWTNADQSWYQVKLVGQWQIQQFSPLSIFCVQRLCRSTS